MCRSKDFCTPEKWMHMQKQRLLHSRKMDARAEAKTSALQKNDIIYFTVY
jgi:hypothetical protein